MPDGEFKATIVSMLTGFEKSREGISEAFTTGMKQLKRNQSEMKNAINKFGNRLNAMKQAGRSRGMN